MDRLRARPGQRGPGDELPPVPGPGRGIEGVEPKLAEDPIINIPDAKIEMYETQLQTAKGTQMRDRIYTEFKAA